MGGGQLAGALTHALEALRVLRGHVVSLSGIRGEIEQLAGADPALADQAEGALGEQRVVLRLGDGESLVPFAPFPAAPLPAALRRIGGGVDAALGQERAEISAPNAWLRGHPEGAQHRGEEIDGLDRAGDPSGQDVSRRDHDERHPHLLLVDGGAVIAAPVLPELLTVIGGDEDHRTGVARPHHPQELPYGVIGEGHLRVVAIHVPGPEIVARVGFVGLVGTEEVQPKEKPLLCGLLRQVVADLPEALLAFCELDLGVLEVEAGLLEAPKARRVDEEDRRRIEGGGSITVGAEQPRPGVRVLPRPLEQ